jgi:CubicO group peptidase (beta-lactamase class C family)
MRRVLFLLALLLLAVGCATTRPDPDAERIDRFIRDAMVQFPEVPSLGVAIVRDGRPLLVRGYGLRDVEQRLPANDETVFYIASSTKSYVGLLAAILASRGVVDLDAPIVRYLPELRFSNGVDPQRVTLRALLTHTAGIQNDAMVMRTAYTGEHTRSGLIELLGRSKPIEPKFKYDNVGYVAAALVLERVTGKNWQDLLASEVFAPMGMQRTTAYMSRASAWPLAAAYDIDREVRMHRMTFAKNDATMHAAGGLVTTPRDLARWLEANVNAGRVGGQQVLPAAAFAEAQKRQADAPERDWYRFKRYAYALGWYHSDYEGATLLHHFGGYEGWRTHISFLPKEKHGVAITTNTSGPGAPLRDLLAAYAYDVLLGKPDVDAAYATHLAAMRERENQQIELIRADIEKRKQRAPTLLRPRTSYAGTYASDMFGTLTIREVNGELRASIGQLDSVLEPFTQNDTARVELVPGSGEVLRFAFEDDDRAVSVKLGDEVFRRE